MTPMRRTPSPLQLLSVPVFPLPQLVLFPGSQVPLHVFEPRYRKLTHDCLAADDPLMVLVQPQLGFETAYDGQPAVYAVGGLGRIVDHERNADGSYDLLVDALARVSLVELPRRGLPYRRATVECLEEHMPPAGLDSNELCALLSLAARITALLQEAQPAFELDLDPEDEPGGMADRIADQLVIAAEGRQAVLECVDVGQRVRLVVAQLLQLHAALCGQHDQNQLLH